MQMLCLVSSERVSSQGNVNVYCLSGWNASYSESVAEFRLNKRFFCFVYYSDVIAAALAVICDPITAREPCIVFGRCFGLVNV